MLTRDAQLAPVAAKVPAPRVALLWSIQYLRATAAFMVVAFHALQSTRFAFWWGAAGVDLFFCISGFLMVSLTRKADITPLRFMADRVARIVPIYWIATLFFFALMLVRPNLIWRRDISLADLAASLAFLPHLNVYGRPAPIVGQGWTLNYEMFFYIVFAVTLGARFDRRLRLLTGWLLILVTIGVLIPHASVVIAAYTAPLLLEFVAGAWLAILWARLDGSPGGDLRFASGALGLTASLLFAGWATHRIGCGWLMFAILAAALALERFKRLPHLGWAKTLGDASYSTYLFQGLTLNIAAHLAARLAPYSGVAGDAVLKLVLGAGGAVLVGLAVFRWIERPASRLSRRWLTQVVGAPATLAGPRSR